MNAPEARSLRIRIVGEPPTFVLMPAQYRQWVVAEGPHEPVPATGRVQTADAARQREVCRETWARGEAVYLEYTEPAGTLRQVQILAIRVQPDGVHAVLVVDLGHA